MNSQSATLRLAVFPHANLITDALLVLAGTALVAAAAQISVKLPFTPVPITGQTFAVLLVGASLGCVRGTASAMLYLWLGVAGAPIYAHHDSGWDVITSASGGYIVGFVLAAARHRLPRRARLGPPVLLLDRRDADRKRVIYLVGLPWLAVVLNTNLEKTLEYGLYPFIPGDIFKLYLAAAALPGAWKLVGRARNRTER